MISSQVLEHCQSITRIFPINDLNISGCLVLCKVQGLVLWGLISIDPLEPQGKPSNGPMSQLTNKRELRATREVLNTFARIVLIQQCLVLCWGPKNSLLLIRFCEFLRRFCLCERCVLDAPATKIAQVLYLQEKKLYIYIYILKRY